MAGGAGVGQPDLMMMMQQAQQMMQQNPELMNQMMGMLGGAGAGGGSMGGTNPFMAGGLGSMGSFGNLMNPAVVADTRPPEERYGECSQVPGPEVDHRCHCVLVKIPVLAPSLYTIVRRTQWLEPPVTALCRQS